MIIYNSYPLFAEAFKPVVNPLFPQGPYEGCLFDKANPALLASNIGIKRTWTVIRYTEVLNDIDNTEVVKYKIVTGIVSDPGLVGYLTTEIPYQDPATFVYNVPAP